MSSFVMTMTHDDGNANHKKNIRNIAMRQCANLKGAGMRVFPSWTVLGGPTFTVVVGPVLIT